MSATTSTAGRAILVSSAHDVRLYIALALTSCCRCLSDIYPLERFTRAGGHGPVCHTCEPFTTVEGSA